VILDFGPNSEIDLTSSEDMRELIRALRSAEIDFALAEVRQPVIETARRTGLLAELREDHICRTIDEAVHTLDAG
jgi:MFS superfamily sulfate permease-like transporter